MIWVGPSVMGFGLCLPEHTSNKRPVEEPPFESSLGEREVRALVRLLGEVAAVAVRPDELRRKLLDALCGMVRAEGWLWGRVDACTGRSAGFKCLARGGAEAGSQELQLRKMTERCRGYLGDRQPVRIGKPDSGSGEGRTQMHFLAGTGSVGEGGDMMISLTRTGMDGWSGIGIWRVAGARGFDQAEARIARILLDELPWLHLGDVPDARTSGVDSLYPRQREVLDLLCRGWSRKRISERLGVSINTVHGYVKAVFKHFGVHSQAELISQIKADGGDV